MRSHYCGGINESHIDQEVTLCGWVHRRRDHGGVIFLDLRDRDGMSQVVVDPDTPESFGLAEKVRSEFVIKVTGRVRRRPAGTENNNMPTGQVELLGKELSILNAAATPPFPLDEHVDVGEDVRLRYRFVDLRRPEMINRLRFRSRVTSYIRNYLDSNGFMDVETPILTRATPEGARDYLVPSRTHEGSFFALPQSPQLFKQLLMVSGVDRYYQIAKCFRDEDLRADRQPEFTQVDIEASFIDEETLMKLNEDMIRSLFKDVLDVELPSFPQMPYAEAMQRYGSDKPDLRIPLELLDVNDLVEGVDFKVFAGAQADIERIETIWTECMDRWGGPFLFGKPTMADAMFAPVCTRFETYDVALSDVAQNYCRTIMSWAPMTEWIDAAKDEPDDFEELDMEF